VEELGQAAEPYLRKTLARNPPLDTRRRIEALLASLAEPRQDRALQVLESIGTEPARRLLDELATGMPEARLTEGAKQSLDRLSTRAAQP
jgi:hypothetical protein